MNEKFMKRAIFLSKKSVETNGGPFGAVVSFRDEIIGEGMNRVTVEKDCSLHAEVVAMRAAQKKLNNFSLKSAFYGHQQSLVHFVQAWPYGAGWILFFIAILEMMQKKLILMTAKFLRN